MPRVPKCRRVCSKPEYKLFKVDKSTESYMTLCVEELESLRLTDLEGLEQGEAAKRMEVSRGTFQRILYEARHKVAKALVMGHHIHIDGGNYVVAPSACQSDRRCSACMYRNEE